MRFRDGLEYSGYRLFSLTLYIGWDVDTMKLMLSDTEFACRYPVLIERIKWALNKIENATQKEHSYIDLRKRFIDLRKNKNLYLK